MRERVQHIELLSGKIFFSHTPIRCDTHIAEEGCYNLSVCCVPSKYWVQFSRDGDDEMMKSNQSERENIRTVCMKIVCMPEWVSVFTCVRGRVRVRVCMTCIIAVIIMTMMTTDGDDNVYHEGNSGVNEYINHKQNKTKQSKTRAELNMNMKM